MSLGRITVVSTHEECADRCNLYSDPSFMGGCKGYLTGMYMGMLFCRSYGSMVRTTPCPYWGVPSSPGTFSGQLGTVHPQTFQENIGGNCCSNATYVANAANS